MIQFRLSSSLLLSVAISCTVSGVISLLSASNGVAYEESRFNACKSIPGKLSTSTATCSSTDLASLSRLQSLGLDVGQKFKFESKLAAGVQAQMDLAIAKYDRWSKCEGACHDLDSALAALPNIQKAMRLELSLMQPDDLALAAIQGPRGWYSAKPKHPFTKSPELALLSSAENQATKSEFLRRLAKVVPSITARIDAISSGAETLTRSPQEATEIEKAILKLRAESRQKYLKLIGENPLIIFLDDHGKPLDRSAIAAAATKLRDETTTEKKRLAGIKDPRQKAEALIEYKSVAETVLRENPRFCVAAEKLAAASDSTRKTNAIKVAVGQVAAGFAAATLCGTVVACGLGAATLATVDFGIAAFDAQSAFRSGVASVAVSESVGDRDVGSAMAGADMAATMQGAILAMGLPTVMKSGADLVRVSVSAFRGAGKAAPALVKGGLLNEVVGGAPASKLNPVLQSFYKDILDSHQGREREIIETLIERLQAKGVKPDKISTTIKDRIRQCVR